MKFYKKTYNDLCCLSYNNNLVKHIGVTDGSVEEIAKEFNEFFREAYLKMWHFYICQVYLESRLLYRGEKREVNGKFALPTAPVNTSFFNMMVGVSPTLITNTRLWPVVLSYFKDFYPEYEKHDPRKDPDYYKFPYKHVTLDFLCFVYQVENRLEMLEEAEKQKMSFISFQNWVTNWVLSYNDDVGEEIYAIKKHPDNILYIKNTKRTKNWRVF